MTIKIHSVVAGVFNYQPESAKTPNVSSLSLWNLVHIEVDPVADASGPSCQE